MNSNGTTYQNGRFVDVDEVHNNTKNMTLSGLLGKYKFKET